MIIINSVDLILKLKIIVLNSEVRISNQHDYEYKLNIRDAL